MLGKKHRRESTVAGPTKSFFAKVLRRKSNNVNESDTQTAARPKRKKAFRSLVRRLILLQRWFRLHSLSTGLGSVMSHMVQSRFAQPKTEDDQNMIIRLLLSPPLMMKITRMLADVHKKLHSITPDVWAEGCPRAGNDAARDRSSIISPRGSIASMAKSARSSLISKMSSKIKRKSKQEGHVALHVAPSVILYSAQADSQSDQRSEGSASDELGRFANSRASINSNLQMPKPKEKVSQVCGIQQVMGLFCQTIHSTKMLTTMTCLHDVVLPLKAELQDMTQKHDALVIQFRDARTSFLKESVALRDQLRKHPDEYIRSGLPNLEEKYFFNAKECLQPHEVSFVMEVVKEELKALLDGSQGKSYALDSSQLQKLLEYHQKSDATERSSDMSSELEKAAEEVRVLKKKLEFQKGNHTSQKFVDMLEMQVSDLRTDLAKERKLVEKHMKHIESLKGDLKQSEDDRYETQKESDELLKSTKHLDSELQSLRDRNSLLRHEVEKLEHKLAATSENQALHAAAEKTDIGSRSNTKSQTEEDAAAYINMLEAENDKLKVKMEKQCHAFSTVIRSSRLEIADSIANLFGLEVGNKHLVPPCPLPELLEDEELNMPPSAGVSSLACPSGAVLSTSSRLEDVEAEISRLQQEYEQGLTHDTDVKRKLAIAEFLRLSIRVQKMFGRWEAIEKKGIKQNVECSCGLASEVKEMQEVMKQLRAIIPQLVMALQSATADSVRMHDMALSLGSEVHDTAASIKSAMAKRAALPSIDEKDVAQLLAKLDRILPDIWTRMWDDADKWVERKRKAPEVVEVVEDPVIDIDVARPATALGALAIEGQPPPKRKVPPISLPLGTVSPKEGSMDLTMSSPAPSPKSRQVVRSQTKPITGSVTPRGGDTLGTPKAGTRSFTPRGGDAFGTPMGVTRSVTPRNGNNSGTPMGATRRYNSEMSGTSAGSKAPKATEESRVYMGFAGQGLSPTK